MMISSIHHSVEVAHFSSCYSFFQMAGLQGTVPKYFGDVE
jgi:hypothetical protein